MSSNNRMSSHALAIPTSEHNSIDVSQHVVWTLHSEKVSQKVVGGLKRPRPVLGAMVAGVGGLIFNYPHLILRP